MLALIVAPVRADQIRQAARSYGDIAFDQAGVLDSEGIMSAVQAAARIAADVFIIDLDAGPGTALVAAMRTYRIARPRTRVLVIAPGREPGDATVASLVALGIYDIVAAPADANWQELLSAALSQPAATFAEAARWHAAGFQEDEQKQKPKERVIIERRPVGAVFIAVGGAAPGVGCTHTTLAIASFLARRKHAVALVEKSDKVGLWLLTNFVRPKDGRVEGATRINGIDMFLTAGEIKGYELFEQKLPFLRSEYEYLVMDLGVIDEARAREMNHAGLAVLVASAARWRWGDLTPYINLKDPSLPLWTNAWRLLLAAPAKQDAEEMRRSIEKEALSMPYLPDPLAGSEEADKVLDELLKPALPQAHPAGRWRWWRR
ncbi:MAG: hypothetical protein PWP65_951 [Clostridia bacterium]|nr:hypothetical protein [Clostridia bacterium]